MRPSRKSNPNSLGLHLKLVFAGSVTTFLGIVMVSVFLVYQQASIMRMEVDRSTEAMRYGLIERARLLADSMASSMEIAIAGYNFTFVSDSVKGLQLEPCLRLRHERAAQHHHPHRFRARWRAERTGAAGDHHSDETRRRRS